jgi:hypothetical protein
MKFVKRQGNNGYAYDEAHINYNGNNQYKVKLGTTFIDKENNNNESTTYFETTFPINNLLIDKNSKSAVNKCHVISVASTSSIDDKGSLRFAEYFKFTSNSKHSVHGYKSANDGEHILLFAYIPFSDDNSDTFTIAVNAKKVFVDDVLIEQEFNVDNGIHIADSAKQLLPYIVLSKSTDEISAQLKNVDGTNATKANIDIYFETTTGYLTKSRSATDANGIATTKIVGSEEGKVKAGFKYFSGKAEINI